MARNPIIVCLFLCLVLSATASTYYVSTSGNNANAGSAASPWRNIYYAGTNAFVSAGDLVLVEPGVYNEVAILRKPGATNNPVTYRADGAVTNTGTFYICTNWVVLDGFTLDGHGTRHSSLSDILVCSNGVTNVSIVNNTIRHSLQTANSALGFEASLYSADACNSTLCIVSNNSFIEVGHQTIIGIHGFNHTFINNTFSNTYGGDPFRIWGANHTVKGNVVYELGSKIAGIYGCGNPDFDGNYVLDDAKTADTGKWTGAYVHTNADGKAYVFTYGGTGYSGNCCVMDTNRTITYGFTAGWASSWTLPITNMVTAPNFYAWYLDHPDFVQTYGPAVGRIGDPVVDWYPGLWSTNHIIENNWVQGNHLGALCQNVCQSGTSNPIAVHHWTFRNNIFIRLASASIIFPYSFWYNNLFYLTEPNYAALSFGWYNPTNYTDPRGEAYYGQVFNNVFLQVNNGNTNAGWYGWSCDGGGNPTQWGRPDFDTVVDYNYVTSSTNTWVGVDPTDFTEPNGINGGNPMFNGIGSDFYRPLFGSILAGAGTNICASDYLGAGRRMDGEDDIGPYEFDKNLRTWFTFEDSFSVTNYIKDWTGYGHHAYQGNPTSWIASATRPDGGNAGLWQMTGMIGNYTLSQFAYITNLTNIDFITNGSVAFWVQWGTVDTNLSGISTGCVRTATILCSGTTYGDERSVPESSTNTWGIAYGILDASLGAASGGLFYRTETNTVRPTNLALFTHSRDASTWYHMAVTWNTNGNVRGYSNGVLVISNELFIYPYLRVADRVATNPPPSATDTIPWFALGANTHGGSLTWGDDSYPNDGYFVGKMDDLRIYDRTLGADEVAYIYNPGYVVSGGDEEPPVEPPATNTVQKAALRGNQTWRGNIRIR